MHKVTLALCLLLLVGQPFPVFAQDTNGSEVVDLSQVDEQPLRLGGRALRYPPMLLAAGVEGQVLVRYIIDERGRIDRSSISVMETDGRSFTQAATDFVRSSRFKPARKGGKPVKVVVEQVIRFDARDVNN